MSVILLMYGGRPIGGGQPHGSTLWYKGRTTPQKRSPCSARGAASCCTSPGRPSAVLFDAKTAVFDARCSRRSGLRDIDGKKWYAPHTQERARARLTRDKTRSTSC